MDHLKEKKRSVEHCLSPFYDSLLWVSGRLIFRIENKNKLPWIWKYGRCSEINMAEKCSNSIIQSQPRIRNKILHTLTHVQTRTRINTRACSGTDTQTNTHTNTVYLPWQIIEYCKYICMHVFTWEKL